jgi:ethanolamine ammonia-lyase small subunit
MGQAQLPANSAALSLPEFLQAIRERTPARLLVGRVGSCYRTSTQLELRQDHAAALDAVYAELHLERDFGPEFITRWGLFGVTTQAGTKAEYLLRPDLGRRLSDNARNVISRECPQRPDVQVVIGDGLSAAAVRAQVPGLLPLLAGKVQGAGWTWGRPFAVRYCRVGVLNDIGQLLDPAVVVLLIGERPGLATADSLSAYLAYRPRAGHTDAQRNLISNIHARGVSWQDAAQRIVALTATMRQMQASGVAVKESLPDTAPRLMDESSAGPSG